MYGLFLPDLKILWQSKLKIENDFAETVLHWIRVTQKDRIRIRHTASFIGLYGNVQNQILCFL